MKFKFKLSHVDFLGVLFESVGEPGWQMETPAEAYIRLTAHNPMEDGHWGIASTWSCRRNDDNSYDCTIVGPRLSLVNWCPAPLLDAAHKAWMRSEFSLYESERTDVSPVASGITPTHVPILDSVRWNDPSDDFDSGHRFGQQFTQGAFGRGF